jgi:intracellular sulfur oxidation DsrE/DsrF family protein
MNKNKLITILFCIVIPLISNADNKKDTSTPYGSSQYYVWPELKNLEELKVAFDFNFNDPKGIERALYPVSFILKTIQEHGPISFEPNIIVVSHGSEVVAWARQNYEQYKDIVDRSARLAELGVKFEVCVVAATALGFEPQDFHGFVNVVPLGTYALTYHAHNGYAVIPGAATLPYPLINPDNRDFLGKENRTKSN